MSKVVNFLLLKSVKFIGVVFLCFSSFSSFSQQKSTFQVGTSITYHPDDWRFSLESDWIYAKLFHQVQFGLGIRKTFFQSQLNPVFSYGFGYNWNFKSFFLRPLVKANYATLRLPLNTNHRFIQQIELYGCGRIGYGKKHAVFLEAGFGPMWEFKYNAYLAKNQQLHYWSYYFQLGYSYAF